MTLLNKPVSAATSGNTGISERPFFPNKIIGAIIVDRNFTLDAATLATSAAIKTALQAATLASGTGRIFPVFRFEEVADNSGDVQIKEFGYGSKRPVRDGKYDFSFVLNVGGVTLQKNLRAFNKATDKKVLFIDHDKAIIGTKTSDGELAGLTLDYIYANPWKVSNGSDPTMYTLRFGLAKPEELNENIGFAIVDFDVEDNVKGLLDLELTDEGVAANKATVKVVTAGGKTDMYDQYSADLADPDLFVVTKAGVAVVVTGVVVNAAKKAWDVSFTGTGEHVISLAAPAALAAAGIGGAPGNGFESNTLTVTLP